MKTLLVIAPGRNVMRDCVFNLLVAETGEHLASHLCSHYGFAKSDLYEGRPERIEEFTKRFGEIEVKYNEKKNAKYSGQPDKPVESMMWKNKF